MVSAMVSVTSLVVGIGDFEMIMVDDLMPLPSRRPYVSVATLPFGPTRGPVIASRRIESSPPLFWLWRLGFDLRRRTKKGFIGDDGRSIFLILG